jgi:MFS family permease
VLTLWYPQARRAQMVGWFMIASAIANAVGSLIGGALLTLDGLAGLAGWQWIFLATGLPAVLLAPVVLAVLPSRPEEARFLTAADKAWLTAELASEPKQQVEGSPWRALLDPRVLLLAALYFGMPLGAYALGYWLPTIVKGFGASNLQNGIINVIPWTCVAIALWALPRHAARYGATRWHIVGPLLVAAAALFGSVVLPGVVVKFACLCIAAAAVFASQPIFWSIPQRLLTGAHAAAGLAAINSIGNLGGFVAQNAVPAIRDATGSDLAPLGLLSIALALSAGGFFLFLPRITRSGGEA